MNTPNLRIKQNRIKNYFLVESAPLPETPGKTDTNTSNAEIHLTEKAYSFGDCSNHKRKCPFRTPRAL